MKKTYFMLSLCISFIAYSSDMNIQKQVKRTFSQSQRQVLNEAWQNNCYPSNETIENIMSKTGLTKEQVYNYFSNKRFRSGFSNKKYDFRQRKILKTYLIENCDHPYPTLDEKMDLMLRTGLPIKKINQWFINARKRYLRDKEGKEKLYKYILDKKPNRKRKLNTKEFVKNKRLKLNPKEELFKEDQSLNLYREIFENKEFFLDFSDL